MPSFAYPRGFHCERTRRAVRHAGFTSACALTNALSSNLDCVFSLARLTIRATTTPDGLGAWLDGQGARVAPHPQTLRTNAFRLYRRAGRRRAAMPVNKLLTNAQAVQSN